MRGSTQESLLVFPQLKCFPWLSHGFTLRQNGIDVNVAREEVIERLQTKHQKLLESQGIPWKYLQLGEQVHGNKVIVLHPKNTGVSVCSPQTVHSDADGLVTAICDVPIGIYVADCCAVFLVETKQRAIGLLHSGRKGTEANIVAEGIKQLKTVCGSQSAEISAFLSPCIHGCCYDVDFVSEIELQLRAEGAGEIWQHPDCTGCHLDRYYSYRREKGCTGRMLAFMMIRPSDNLSQRPQRFEN